MAVQETVGVLILTNILRRYPKDLIEARSNPTPHDILLRAQVTLYFPYNFLIAREHLLYFQAFRKVQWKFALFSQPDHIWNALGEDIPLY